MAISYAENTPAGRECKDKYGMQLGPSSLNKLI